MQQATDRYRGLASAFKAMGHPTRLALLVQISKRPFCVSELQQELNQSQSNTSQHLAILRDRGLVVPERKGNTTCYQLADERIADLLSLGVLLIGRDNQRGAGEDEH